MGKSGTVEAEPSAVPTVVTILMDISPASFTSYEQSTPEQFPAVVLPTFPDPERGRAAEFLRVFTVPLTTATSIPEYPVVARCVRGPVPRTELLVDGKAIFYRGQPGGFFSRLLELGFATLVLRGAWPALRVGYAAITDAITDTTPLVPVFKGPSEPGVGATFGTVLEVAVAPLVEMLVFATPRFFVVTEGVYTVPRGA